MVGWFAHADPQADGSRKFGGRVTYANSEAASVGSRRIAHADSPADDRSRASGMRIS